jgi:hypothetical protein
MMRVRSNRVGRTGFALSAILGLLVGAASCGNLIGLEDWKEPGDRAGQGGEGGSQAGSGGSGGEAGMGGAGGSATSSSSTAGTGGIIEQELTPDCQECLAKCQGELDACEADANCNQNYRPCMGGSSECCKASGGAWAGPAAQTLYGCLLAKCDIACTVNAHCGDCLINGPETDLDCGGDSCNPCETGQECAWDGDCESAACSVGGTCM